MTRDELVESLSATKPSPDDVLYVQRTGESYGWRVRTPDAAFAEAEAEAGGVDSGHEQPDVWIYSTGPWARDGEALSPAFVQDLLDEMESMLGGADRCRWPLDDPLSHRH